MKYLSFLLFFLITPNLWAQKTAVLEGTVIDAQSREPLAYATIRILNDGSGQVADSLGRFRMELAPGLYNLEASYAGYVALILHEVQVSTAKPLQLDIALAPQANELSTVEVRAEAFRRTSESPLSLHVNSVYEIERMPGATMDVSRFIRTLPGVTPRASFGYNLILRGGAANENRFYLDGVEIPAITHFTVQGTSGGPNGLINMRMLRKTELHTGAFPAGRPNALSSVLELYMREGRRDRLSGNFTLGATDWGVMLEGPMGKKSNFMISARESYSQHMFEAIGLPVIPFYADAQYKQVVRFDPKNELTLIGLFAFDRYTLNLDAEISESLLYNTGYIPEGTQLQYTGGAVYKHYLPNSYYTLVASRSYFNNFAEKYRDNTYLPEDQTLLYRSIEAENRLRLEHKIHGDGREWNYGLSAEYDQISVDNFSFFTYPDASVDTLDYQGDLNLFRYGAFGSVSQSFAAGRGTLFAGLRIDASNYGRETSNPLDQLSPRLAASYAIAKNWTLNASTGIYYQLPPYVVLSYMENGDFVNRDRVGYMRSMQAGLGIDHTTESGYQVKLETFYKDYDNYPFLLLDSISLANANANYVLIGNQPASSTSAGRAYGVEFSVRQKFTKTYFWSLSYSFVVSQFQAEAGQYISSSWDNRHFGTAAVGKNFKGNWQVGLRWSFSGGSPYTPYDIDLSAQRGVWDLNRRGLSDFSRLNQERLPFYHQMDFRVDKQFNFKRWSLQVYIDVQNLYRSPIASIPYLTVERDGENNPLVDPLDSGRYLTRIISSDTGRVLPSLGILLDI